VHLNELLDVVFRWAHLIAGGARLQ